MARRINKLNDGFVSASSNNLPSVDFEMFLDFVSKTVENTQETQGWKLSHSCRENYGDNAIGYVQVKRTKQVVDVLAKITPEHRVRENPYSVSAQVDEKSGVFNFVRCNDCVASAGVCKHAVAFAMWLHRRTEEPSPTSTYCYWKKSVLSTVKDQGTFLKVAQIKPKNSTAVAGDVASQVLSKFLQKEPANCQLYLHFNDVDAKIGSVHSLIFKFLRTSNPKDGESFLSFMRTALDDAVCKEIEEKSMTQSKTSYWYEMRYARVTASKLHEISRCKTNDGSLVNQILGSSKFKGNFATKRGLILEEKVKSQLEIEKGQVFRCSGFLVDSKYPFCGASPDGVSDTHVLEIKCPSKQSTVKKYISTKNAVSDKYFAQVQMQMYFAKKRKGFFCVADPKFETNFKITVVELTLKPRYVESLLHTAKCFWIKNTISSTEISRNFKHGITPDFSFGGLLSTGSSKSSSI